MTAITQPETVYDPELGDNVRVAKVDHANRLLVGNAGKEVGSSNFMLHCGAQEVTFDDLRQVPVPQDTDTYTAVPHQDFVMSMYKHADRLLKPRGFTLDGERYALDKEGNRLFFIHHYQNGDTELQMAMGCRNSYDKSMKAAVAYGSRVFVCDNLSISGDIDIAALHRGRVLDNLNEKIILSMYKASDGWDDTRKDRDAFVEYSLDEDDGYALMGLIKSHTAKNKEASRRILTSDKDWKAVQSYWEEPKHEYEGGNRTLWAWYNSFTFDFKSLKPHEQLQKHASLHQFTKSAIDGYNGSERMRKLTDMMRSNDEEVAQFAEQAREEINEHLNNVIGENDGQQ